MPGAMKSEKSYPRSIAESLMAHDKLGMRDKHLDRIVTDLSFQMRRDTGFLISRTDPE